MIWTARTAALLVTLALGSVGAAWGIHALVTAGDSGTDYGLDTNGNGAYDWLVVEADVTLPSAGTWTIYADLSTVSPPAGGVCGYGYRSPPPMLEASASYGPISWTNERYFFPSGPQTIRMAFVGTDINRAGVDGPYLVHATLYLGDVIMYGGTRPIRDGGQDFLEWNYMTKAYAASSFEMPVRPAYFTGGHSDAAIDLDGDGLADFLALQADVKVNIAGNYSLNGVLTAGPSSDAIRMIAYSYRTVGLTTSDTMVSLRFRGDQIRAAGVDGPWNFSLTLYGPVDIRYGNVTPLPVDSILPQPAYYPETLCGVTSAYRASNFDDTVELLRYTGRFQELAPDDNRDGTYDALVIRAEVEVFVSAGFDLNGVLQPVGTSRDAALVSGQVWLTEGIEWAEFRFAGPDIYASGLDGPYIATLSLTPGAWGIDPTTTYTTLAYHATDFDSAPRMTQP